MTTPVGESSAYISVCTTFVLGLITKIFIAMDNYYNEESDDNHQPNDGHEELDIEPINWDDM